jgi:hypothetical protein
MSAEVLTKAEAHSARRAAFVSRNALSLKLQRTCSLTTAGMPARYEKDIYDKKTVNYISVGVE